MKMCSDCSGDCCVCGCGGGCIAGHGDDYYTPATKEQVISRLDAGKYLGFREQMVKYLKDRFGYDYPEHSNEIQCNRQC